VVSLISPLIELSKSTIRNNIVLDRDVSESGLLEVLCLTLLRDFVYGFANREFTTINPHDPTIVPCERKRIALARAILADSNILVFDEPLMGMEDCDSEQAIQSTVRDMSHKKTTIILTNNPALVTDVDCIYMLDKGKVVESGNHHSLIGGGGLYANLYLRYFTDSSSLLN